MAELTPEQLKELGEIQTCAVANAIETFDIIPRNTGFMMPSVKSIFPKLGSMYGYAVTHRSRRRIRPLPLKAMAFGAVISPGLGPGEPHESRKEPSGEKIWMRSFPRSQTCTLPSGATATPTGKSNSPGADPGMPQAS